MGVGSVIFSLPHFLSESYTSQSAMGPNMTDENICKVSSPAELGTCGSRFFIADLYFHYIFHFGSERRLFI